MWYGPRVLVEREDAEAFVVGADVTFINWGNIRILKINRNPNTNQVRFLFTLFH